MDVPKLTIVYAVLLILLGVIGYFASGAVSVTALIPAFFGIVILTLGILASKRIGKKHAMHAAAVLSLIGFVATVGGSDEMVELLTGGDVARPGAVISRSLMSILSLAYFIVSVLSFVIARANRADDA
jgi:hypothetical protein